MKNKDKKLLLNIVALLAVAFSIAQFFFPVYTYNTNDEPVDYAGGFKKENYILFNRYIIFDEKGSIKQMINFPLHIEGDPLDFEKRLVVDRDEDYQTSNFLVPTLIVLTSITVLYFMLFYFSYKGIRYCGTKKTRYFLYSALVLSVLTMGFIAGTYFILHLLIGNIHIIRFDFSFYYMIIAISLFFASYIIQTYFINYEKDKPTIEKMLFERYKKD